MRMTPVRTLLGPDGGTTPGLRLVGILIAAAALYGASFGLWRGGPQPLWSAVKMPALLLAVTAAAAPANFLLARALGLAVEAAQVVRALLLAYAVTALLLASLAPVFAFAAWTLPGPASADAQPTCRLLLLLHTAAVGLAGTAGHLRQWRWLATAARGDVRLATRVFVAWFAVSALAGSELSWVCSPFLARPDRELVFLNPNAFTMNMYEYLWQSLQWGRGDGTCGSN